ncbi:MAG: hypothetical protein ABI353_06955 [Isosphaeraceae bacterium]
MTWQRSGWMWVAVVGLVVGLSAPEVKAADDKANATGTWKSSVERNGQTFETTLKLTQDGEKLTGTISGRNGTETAIEDGQVKGDDVSFKVTRTFNDNTFVMTYKVKVSGDSLKGKVEFERNGETQSRDWEAKRS